MTPTEIVLPDPLPKVRTLSRTDKLRLIEILAHELAHEEVPFVVPGATYPIWTPFFTEDASTAMLQELEKGGDAP